MTKNLKIKKSLNKVYVAKCIAQKANLTTTQARSALKAITECITDALKEGKNVQFIGFGTFKINHRDERIGRNPKTGEQLKIKAVNVPVFVAGKTLKEAVN